MSENSTTLYTRISQLYGNNWPADFVPTEGELVVFPAAGDKRIRFKIGDGTTKIGTLPFANDVDDFKFNYDNTTNEHVLTVTINGVEHKKSVPATTPVLTDGVEIASVGDNKIYAPRVTAEDITDEQTGTDENLITATYTDDNNSVNISLLKSLLKEQMLEMMYPVGSIYMSFNSTTPQTLFGGTWVHLPDSYVLMNSAETSDVMPDDAEIDVSKKYKILGQTDVKLDKNNIPELTTTTNGWHGHSNTVVAAGLTQHIHNFATSSSEIDLYSDNGTASYPGKVKINSGWSSENGGSKRTIGAHTHGGATAGIEPLNGESLFHTHTLYINESGNHEHTVGVAADKQQSVSVIQPSLKCHMWRRTA